jgi:putative nucleotidyltransferase with HDIG domain
MTIEAVIFTALGVGIPIAINEILNNSAWIAELLVRRAASRIPIGRQEAVIAEWLAELDFIRPRRSKLATIAWAAFVYCRSWRQAQILEGNDPAVGLLAAHAVISDVRNLHLAAMEALALAIDAKGQNSQSHLRRVQVYAAGLARALGMPDDEIEGVKTAALLHDIGKLAVPEHILSKPGPLTQEEFQKVRIHTQVGADVISGVPFPYPVAPAILSHHERWDGKGYPSGLRGEEIALGARILSVADYFDALMSERPYHRRPDRFGRRCVPSIPINQ